jgi:A/G-specific adenine glycosylase
MTKSRRPKPPAPQAESLLAWYDAHGRDLPWRVKGGGRADPYRVWLSEIMLQQTTVAAVRGYFERFVRAWPDVASLAAAPLEDVLREWAGLGYYSRARNLHAAAQAVMREFGGVFPRGRAELRSLPGVGAYTSAAIAAIAFDRPETVVDGNVERVLSRIHAVEEPLPKAKPALTRLAEALTPQRRAGDYAQAIMDLGATVCTPRKPDCGRCPWAASCEGRALGTAETFPRKLPKGERPVRRGTAFYLLSAKGNVLLRRRAPKGLLGGMLEFPSTPWTADGPENVLAHAPAAVPWSKAGARVEHTFTHFHLILDVLIATIADEDPGLGLWVPAAGLASAGLPSVMRKIGDAAQDCGLGPLFRGR